VGAQRIQLTPAKQKQVRLVSTRQWYEFSRADQHHNATKALTVNRCPVHGRALFFGQPSWPHQHLYLRDISVQLDR
jgi:hypothetical protein